MAELFEVRFFLKIVALLHILVASAVLVIAILVQPVSFFCTGIPLVSFQLFVMSWWVWRFPTLDSFKERWLIFISKKQLLTPEQRERRLRRAWLIQLDFVLIWGWLCALIFWSLATWIALSGGCAPTSILLIGDLFVAVVGWIIGGAWVIQVVYRDSETIDDLKEERHLTS